MIIDAKWKTENSNKEQRGHLSNPSDLEVRGQCDKNSNYLRKLSKMFPLKQNVGKYTEEEV